MRKPEMQANPLCSGKTFAIFLITLNLVGWAMPFELLVYSSDRLSGFRRQDCQEDTRKYFWCGCKDKTQWKHPRKRYGKTLPDIIGSN